MEKFSAKARLYKAARFAFYLYLIPFVSSPVIITFSDSPILAEKGHRVENKNKPLSDRPVSQQTPHFFVRPFSLSILPFPFNLCLGKARASKRLGEKEGKERAPFSIGGLTRKWRNNELWRPNKTVGECGVGRRSVGSGTEKLGPLWATRGVRRFVYCLFLCLSSLCLSSLSLSLSCWSGNLVMMSILIINDFREVLSTRPKVRQGQHFA